MYIFLTYVYIFLSERQQESRLHQHLESKALLHAVRKGNAERTQEEVRRHLPTRLSCCLETFFVNRVKKADWKMRQEENMGNWTSEWESRALLHELCAAPGILIVVPSDMVCECTELGNRISTSNSIEVVQFRKGPRIPISEFFALIFKENSYRYIPSCQFTATIGWFVGHFSSRWLQTTSIKKKKLGLDNRLVKWGARDEWQGDTGPCQNTNEGYDTPIKEEKKTSVA